MTNSARIQTARHRGRIVIPAIYPELEFRSARSATPILLFIVVIIFIWWLNAVSSWSVKASPLEDYSTPRNYSSAERSPLSRISRWRVEEGNPSSSIKVLEPTNDQLLPDRTTQLFQLAAKKPSQVSLVYPIPPLRVINELKVKVWVKSDQPGAILQLRIILPEARHPETGKPLETFLLFQEYRRPNRWEELIAEDVARKLRQQLFVLRAKFGSSVELRGAVVDQVMVRVYVAQAPQTIIVGAPQIEGAVHDSEVVVSSFQGPQPLSSVSSFSARQPGVHLGHPVAIPSHPHAGPSSLAHPGSHHRNDSERRHQAVRSEEFGAGAHRSVLGERSAVISAGYIEAPESYSPEQMLQSDISLFEDSDPKPDLPTRNESNLNYEESSPQADGPRHKGIGRSSEGPDTRAEQHSQSEKHLGGQEMAQAATTTAGTGTQPDFLHWAIDSFQEVGTANQDTGASAPPGQRRASYESPSPVTPRAPFHMPIAWAEQSGQPSSPTRMVGSSLMVGNRPMFPRLLAWRGESVSSLRQLGVNGIWIDSPYPAELLPQAREHDFWVVLPPVFPPVGDTHMSDSTADGFEAASIRGRIASSPHREPAMGVTTAYTFAEVAKFPPEFPAGTRTGSQLIQPMAFFASDPAVQSPGVWPQYPGDYSRVLGWVLPGDARRESLDQARLIADHLRGGSWPVPAPLVCRSIEATHDYSRIADILLLERPLLGGNLELESWSQWLRGRSFLARPGTPFWAAIPVDYPPQLLEQIHFCSVLPESTPVPTWEQVRLAAFQALSAEIRGLVFTASARLDSPDRSAEIQRCILELINLELQLIEPFLAGGTFVGQTGPTESLPVKWGMYRTERARLLMPVWVERCSQWVCPAASAFQLPLVIAGVPESYNAYLIVPGAIRPLRHRRVAGGIEVMLDEFTVAGLVLLTQDPLIMGALNARASELGPRTVSLLIRHARDRLSQLAAYQRFFAGPGVPESWQRNHIVQAEVYLQRAGTALQAWQYAEAWAEANRALRLIRTVEHDWWQSVATSLGTPVAHPLAVSFSTAAWCRESLSRLATGSWSEELLPGGDCEDLGLMLQLGWRHFQNPHEPAAVLAALSPEAAHSGRFGLEIRVEPRPGEREYGVLESIPAWVLTPSVPVEAGDWVCVQVWVNIPEPLRSSVDGFIVAESLGGMPLAARWTKSDGWQLIRLYRVVPPNRRLEIALGVAGYGRVMLDEISVRRLSSAAFPGVVPDWSQSAFSRGPSDFSREPSNN